MHSKESMSASVSPVGKDAKGRRLSKAGSRSRSNTLTSTTSSFDSPEASISSGESQGRPFSHEDYVPVAAPSHEQRPNAKSFFARGGRMLKRQGSKFSLLTLSEETSDTSDKTWIEKADPFRGRSKSASARGSTARKTISHPFDFQHVVHTGREEFEKLEKAERKQVEMHPTSYSTSLKSPTYPSYTQTHFDDFSSESLIMNERPKTSGGDQVLASPTTPPRPPPMPRTTTFSGESYAHFRMSRSIENFSRPAPRSPQSPISPPSRRSSRNAFTFSEIDRVTTTKTQGSPVVSPTLPHALVGHAVSTVDDSARVMKNKPLPPLQTELVVLPEEAEATEGISPRDTSNERTSDPISRSSLKSSQFFSPKFSFPEQNMGSRRLTGPSRRISSIEEDPIPMPETHCRENALDDEEISIGIFKPVHEDSWEDDIDYCYEHAAEADCEFEWGRQSSDLTRDRANTGESPCGSTGTVGPYASHLQQALSPNMSDTLPQSARTASTNSDILTPRRAEEDRRQHQPAIYNPEHMGEEGIDIYDELVPTSDDKIFHMYSQVDRSLPALSMSSHGSRSSMSKYNSQESMMLSRAASIVRTHRSSNSAGSLPELVHSMTSLKDAAEGHDPRGSIIMLPRSTSASKLSLMRTPSLTSGTNSVTAASSLREQTSADEIRLESYGDPASPPLSGPKVIPSGVIPETEDEEAIEALPTDALGKMIPPPSTSASVAHHPTSHSHSVSESIPSTKYSDPTPFQNQSQSFASRMRANSAAATRPRRPSTRASYSLFPSAAAALKTPPPNVEMGGFF